MPITAIPMGGEQDCLMIWQSRGYDLPFKVEGYFDLRHYEPVSKLDHPAPVQASPPATKKSSSHTDDDDIPF
jgi:hypothetical protein